MVKTFYRRVGRAGGGPGAKEVYPALCASLFLHLIVMSLFLSGSMDMSGAPTATEVIVISLGPVTVDSELVTVSDDTVKDDPAQIQTAGMVPDSADAGPARVAVEEKTTESLITTTVKVPETVPETVIGPVPEPLQELVPEKAPEKKTEKESEKNTEKTDLGPVPALVAVQEETPFRKEASGGPPAGFADSGEPTHVPTEGSAEASVSAVWFLRWP